MEVHKAIITAAGKTNRHLPLQTVVDSEGAPSSAYDMLLRELQLAGIEKAAVVIAPGDRDLYASASAHSPVAVELIEQHQARGYGHAVLCARSFVGADPFLLMVSDHLFLSETDKCCVRQLLDIAQFHDCPVSAVQATHESKLAYFGAIGGSVFENGPEYTIERVMEKPTPTQAEQYLFLPGLRHGYYLCFFGLHVLTPRLMTILAEQAETLSPEATFTISPALEQLARKERLLAARLKGMRYDLGQPYGLLLAQLAQALHSKNRTEVLAQLVEMLAQAMPQHRN